MKTGLVIIGIAAALAGLACTRAQENKDSKPAAAPAAPAPAPALTKRDAELLAAAKDPAIVKAGKANYEAFCKACHGEEKATTSDAVSNLYDTKWYHGGKPTEIEATVLNGVLEKGMPGWGQVLQPEDTTALTAYLLSFQPH